MSALDDIRNAIGSSVIGQELMVASTLTKTVEGAYDINEPTAGPAKTITAYPCRAVAQKYGGRFKAPSEIRDNMFVVTIMLTTLPAGIVPATGDTVTITPPGPTNVTPVTARISRIREIDPAGVTATCDVVGP